MKNLLIQSMDDLSLEIEKKWKSLAFTEYSLRLKSQSGSVSKLQHVSQLDFNIVNHILVIPNLKGFSKGADLDSALQELGVAEANFIVDNSKFTECTLFDGEIDAAARILVADMLIRMRLFKPESGERLSDCTCHEFVSPLLLYSLNIVFDYLKAKGDPNELMLCCEKGIVGRRFHGPVDYSIMYALFEIILTEAKKSDLQTGLYQNLLQQHASLELLSDLFIDRNVLGTKRRFDYINNYNDLKYISTAGIVTTGKAWVFNKVIIDKNADKKHIYRSSEIDLTLNSLVLNQSTAEPVMDGFRESMKKLMKLICQLVLEQIEEIQKHQALISKYSEGFSPVTLWETQLARSDIVQTELEDAADEDDEEINDAL